MGKGWNTHHHPPLIIPLLPEETPIVREENGPGAAACFCDRNISQIKVKILAFFNNMK
jgi:hypothetical protein